MVRQQLETVDPRLVRVPMAHPFADKVEKGTAALVELIELVETPTLDVRDRILALEAISAILASHGENAVCLSVLRNIAAQPDQHPKVRAAATRAILMSGDEAFLQAFQARLASSDPRVAASAAHSMGVARHEPAVEALIELFATHPSVAVQSKAAWALGEIGSTRALEILEAAFRAERVLIPVIEALGKLGSAHSLSLLTLALRDADESIRLTGAEAIHRIILRHHDSDLHAVHSYLLAALEAETNSRVGVVLISCLRQSGAVVPKKLVQHALTVSARKEGSVRFS